MEFGGGGEGRSFRLIGGVASVGRQVIIGLCCDNQLSGRHHPRNDRRRDVPDGLVVLNKHTAVVYYECTECNAVKQGVSVETSLCRCSATHLYLHQQMQVRG